MDKEFFSPELYKKHPGILARYIERNHENPVAKHTGPLTAGFEEQWFSKRELICVSTDLPVYSDRTIRLGETPWVLTHGSYILLLHLNPLPTKHTDSFFMAKILKNDAEEVLQYIANRIEPISHHIPYIVAASSTRLAQALCHLVPGFQVVDYLSSLSGVAHNVWGYAQPRGGKFLAKVLEEPLPVVAIPREEFIRVCASRKKW